MKSILTNVDFTSRLEIAIERIGESRISIREKLGKCTSRYCKICPNDGNHGTYYSAKWRVGDGWQEIYLGKSIPKGYAHLLNKSKKRKPRHV